MSQARVLELRYPAPSEVAADPTTSKVRLALEGGRTPVGVVGRVTEPELLRDALLTAVAIKDSDLRYKGKDRSAYLAYLMKQGKKATKAIWEAQKSFLEGAYSDDTRRQRGLDPVLTVDPDEVSLEVFSRDESAYARLSFDSALFADRKAAHGTTLTDLSPAFVEQLERVRTYQPVELEAETRLSGKPEPPVGDFQGSSRQVELPDAWLRGFLQVQSAATLPSVTAHLATIDLYNVLFVLRLRKAKKAPRALRFELVPGLRPRLVLEPWEIALECHGEPFRGSTPRIVRTYGRQRLLALAGALPHTESVQVHLQGPGLPSFWVLDMGAARLTIALTSWAESSWASTASFDALMPRSGDDKAVNAVISALQKKGPLSLEEVASAAGQDKLAARASLQRACLRGQVLFDLGKRQYRPRALLAEPVDEGAIRYGSPREALAHRLLGDGSAGEGNIQLTKIHEIAGEGREIHGTVEDKGARRGFTPHFTLDLESQVKDAWCNCPTYQRSRLREGPCEHMIALYVFHKRDEADRERLRQTPEGRKLIRAETRTLVRRDATGSQTSYRVSLDDRVVRIEKKDANAGQPFGDARHQRMWFDSDAEAKSAYFSRLDELAGEGFIDTDAMSA
jgi:hypothetical protein